MKLSVLKPSKNNAAAPSKKGTIRLIETSDILAMPETDAFGIACLNDFELRPGAEFQYLYLTPTTQKFEINNDGDADSRLFRKKIFGSYPGNEIEIFQFIKQNINKSFVAVYKECDVDYSKIFGSKTNPLFVSPNYKDDSNSKTYEIILEQNDSDDVPILFYNSGAPVIVDDGLIEIEDLTQIVYSGSYKPRKIYLVAAELTLAELEFFNFPVIFRVCADGKTYDITYDLNGNKFSDRPAGSIKNVPTFADLPIPGDITVIYKTLDQDELYVWDADRSTYILSSIDDIWKASTDGGIAAALNSIDGINNELVTIETHLTDLEGNDISLQDQIDTEIVNRATTDLAEATARANADTAEASARANADALKLNKPTAPNNTSEFVINGDGTTSPKGDFQRSSQVQVSANTTADDSWKGKLIKVTTSCTITIPSALVSEWTADFKTYGGVSLNFAMTSPKIWAEGAPSTVGEKRIFNIFQDGSTDNLYISGI